METRADRLLRRVEKTRKARIRAAERLGWWDRFASFVIVYYSTGLVALSIWNMRSDDDRLALMLVIASVSLVIFSTWTQTLSLGARSASLKQHYIELQRISSALENVRDTLRERPGTPVDKELDRLEQEYRLLLQGVENHRETDYLLVLLADPDTDVQRYWQRLKPSQWLHLSLHWLAERVIMAGLVVAPLLLWLWWRVR